ncbi:ribose 5-phosphate isomerase [Metarhizium album ARSEF 1941]|uniref:Ribose 5-phosphate isomerase n=1 Tax=Metarhizium album (strain ARSEF 1941) TaxID=1081103 RepID=A0A0B2WM75_METAS|nr:ribose 5-phosphate isomerase [Metarhizium album ARSEF 1941]KHN95058.1 ribose 5-phosphate isomerase [Metarhizium album ARSEF 1941]
MGCDDAGVAYKDAIKRDFEADSRVTHVIDVGAKEPSDKTAYPLRAAAAARIVERVVGLELARRLAREWLGYEFDTTTASAKKVDEIISLEA